MFRAAYCWPQGTLNRLPAAERALYSLSAPARCSRRRGNVLSIHFNFGSVTSDAERAVFELALRFQFNCQGVVLIGQFGTDKGKHNLLDAGGVFV